MSKEMKESLKLLGLITSLFVFYLLCFWMLYLLFNEVSSEDQANFWKDLVMMMLSAIFSATVAYIVSIQQIKRDLKRQKQTEKRLNHKRVALLIVELEDNMEALELLKKQNFPDLSQNLLSTQISFEMYDKYIDKVELNEQMLRSLIKQHKKLILFKSYSQETMKIGFDDIYRILEQATMELKKQIEEEN